MRWMLLSFMVSLAAMTMLFILGDPAGHAISEQVKTSKVAGTIKYMSFGAGFVGLAIVGRRRFL